MSSEVTTLQVRVVPSAPRDQILGLVEGVWRIKIAAPPVAGEANEELVSFLARVLGLPRRQVSLIRGHTSRRKALAIAGLSPEAMAARLAQVARR